MERGEMFIQHMGRRNYEGEPNSFESILNNYRGAQELDTLLLRDGEIVVLNERQAGLTPEQVESMTLPELEHQLSVATPDREGRPSVPRFTEFLGLAADADTQLRVELRGSRPEQAVRLARAAIDRLAEMTRAGGFRQNPDFPKKRLRFVTFSIPALQEIQRAATDRQLPASTGLFWPSAEVWVPASGLFDETAVAQVPDIAEREWNERGILVAQHYGFSEIELQPEVITARHVALAHARHLEIGASLIRDKNRAENIAQHLVALGVDHILTER